jgi:hypothetical protein
MRAIVQTEYGSADVLRVGEIDRPEMGDDEPGQRVLVPCTVSAA